MWRADSCFFCGSTFHWGYGKVAAYLATCDGGLVCYVATDGGCLLARAAEHPRACEQTPAEGERVAVFDLCRVLLLLLHGRRLRGLVDNQSVAGRVIRSRDACAKADSVESHGVGCAVDGGCLDPSAWHDRNPDWHPPAGWCGAGLCREVNARADEAAVEALNPFRTRHLLCSDLHGVSPPGSTNAFEKTRAKPA